MALFEGGSEGSFELVTDLIEIVTLGSGGAVSAPVKATMPASLATDSPAVRMTTSSLLLASPPRPSKAPIRTAIGNISNDNCGSRNRV